MDYNWQNPGVWQLPRRLAGHRHRMGSEYEWQGGEYSEWCKLGAAVRMPGSHVYIAIDILGRTNGAAPVLRLRQRRGPRLRGSKES